MNKSILDQVLSTQKMSAISSFSPEDLARELFAVLNEREQDIIMKRYGLKGDEKVTLEEIGKTYSVTRERVRQVENASLKRIRDTYKESILRDVEYLLRDLLDDHGHIMSEERLIELLLQDDKYSPTNVALTRFLLNQLLYDRLVLAKDSRDIYKSWTLPTASWDTFYDVIEKLVKIIDGHAEPLKLEQLLESAQAQVQLPSEFEPKYDIIVVNYLDVTKKIEENKFNEWGLSHWNSIRPRRMNDKIYLIMKKEGKPMHFTEIAKKINEAAFDDRVAYPATIHNELILDDKYVLVGRGIYALKEWGYKPGVVLEVIKDIVRDSKKPMTRDDIIAEVLKNRLVKKSTVALALMNKKHFRKDDAGAYSLVTD